MTSTAVLLIIAIVGTTVAPWQLFFQQSNIVDKRITPRWINYERADTFLGSIVVVIAASALVVTAAFAFRGTGLARHFTNAAGVASGLDHTVGHGTGALFALVLLNASIIGAAAVTLSTSYAFGDISGCGIRFTQLRGREAVLHPLLRASDLRCGHRPDPRAPLGLITTAFRRWREFSCRARQSSSSCSATTRRFSAVGQPPMAERIGRFGRLRAAGAVAHLDDDHRVPEPGSHQARPGPWSDHRGRVPRRGSWALLPHQRAKRRLAVQLIAAAARETKVRRETWRMPPLALLARPVWSADATGQCGSSACTWSWRCSSSS